MKFVAVGFAVLLNTLTRPPCCTTNQRELSPGACSTCTPASNVRLVNTSWKVKLALCDGGAPATQLVLLGRKSRPEVGAACVVAFAAVDRPETLGGMAA